MVFSGKDSSYNSTNQKRESTVFSLLIGQNMRPFPENTVLYYRQLKLTIAGTCRQLQMDSGTPSQSSTRQIDTLSCSSVQSLVV